MVLKKRLSTNSGYENTCQKCDAIVRGEGSKKKEREKKRRKKKKQPLEKLS